MLSLARWWRTRSNEATPLSSQATASPSIMQERERRRANASTIRPEATGEVVAGTAGGMIPHCMNDPQPEGHMASHIERRKFLATLGAVFLQALPIVSGERPT